MARKINILPRPALLLILQLAVVAGCAKIQGDGPRYSDIPVGFDSYAARTVSNSPASRADDSFVPTGTTTLPADSEFGVFAFYQQGVVGSTTAHWSDGGWSPAFMFNQQVSFDGTNYSYSPLRYWPANEENTISFWAYYPYSAYTAGNTGSLKMYESDKTTAYSRSSTGMPYVTYTVDRNPANQSDLLFDSFANTDKTYENCLPTPGTVPLVFRHALSLVEFQLAEGEEALINSFSLAGVYWTGACANPSAVPIVWQEWSNTGSYSIADLAINNGTICALILMPQTLSASVVLTINYDLSYPSSDPNYPDPIVYSGNTGSAQLSTAGIAAWQPGKHYVYKIAAGFERIEFEEVLDAGDDWTVGSSDISVPE